MIVLEIYRENNYFGNVIVRELASDGGPGLSYTSFPLLTDAVAFIKELSKTKHIGVRFITQCDFYLTPGLEPQTACELTDVDRAFFQRAIHAKE